METSTGERLRYAIRKSDFGSIRAFADEIGRRPEGKSKRVIFSYLDGTREPPVGFIREASDLLDVREAWLGFGDGTERHSVDTALTAKVERVWGTLAHDSAVAAQLHVLLNRRVLAVESRGGRVDEDRTLEWAQEIRDLVEGPWKQLTQGIGSTTVDWYNYRVAMLHALMLAIPDGYFGSE